jgi:hypothetical protein
MSTSLSEIEKRTVPINQYIESLEQPFQEKFLARKQDYRPNAEATTRLTGFQRTMCWWSFLHSGAKTAPHTFQFWH